MDTLIGLAAFLTQFQRFLSHLGVDSLSFNHGDALAEARGGAAEGERSDFCAT